MFRFFNCTTETGRILTIYELLHSRRGIDNVHNLSSSRGISEVRPRRNPHISRTFRTGTNSTRPFEPGGPGSDHRFLQGINELRQYEWLFRGGLAAFFTVVWGRNESALPSCHVLIVTLYPTRSITLRTGAIIARFCSRSRRIGMAIVQCCGIGSGDFPFHALAIASRPITRTYY
jgi:hypothetical protein